MIALAAHFRRCERATASVEMALMLPLLLVLLFGGLEAGYFMYVEHQVLKGVRDGARYGSRQSFLDATCTTITPAVKTAIQEVTRTGMPSGGLPRVPGWDDNATEVTVTPSCPTTPLTTGIYKGATNAPQINISATVPYPSLFNALGLIDVNITLRATQQTAVMGI